MLEWTRVRLRQLTDDLRGVPILPFGRGEGMHPWLAKDNAPYIVAARRRALAIVLVGALGVQLASDESERERAASLYGYVEKVLVLSAAVASASEWRKKDEEPLLAGQLQWDLSWLPMFIDMVGSDRRLVPIEFNDADRLFATATDPANACKIAIYHVAELDEGDDSGLALLVKFPSPGYAGERLMTAQRAFIARVGTDCPAGLAEAGQTFLVVRYADGGSGVVVDQRIAHRLGFLWPSSKFHEQVSRNSAPDRQANRKAWFGEFLTDAQLRRLDSYPSPFLKTLDETSLTERIVRHANAAAGQSFDLGEWRAAIRAIVDRNSGPIDLWGLRFERELAARAFPLLLLALGFSFLSCVRRLNPNCDLRAEPWTALRPRGVLETVGALAWAATTFVAVGAVSLAACTFDLCSYEPGVPGASDEIQRELGEGFWELAWFMVTRPGFQGVSLAWLALLLLAIGWIQVWSANRRHKELEGRAAQLDS